MIENLSMSIIQCIIVMLTIVFVGKIIIWYPIKSTGTLWFLCMLALKIFVLWAATGPIVYLIRELLIYINLMPEAIKDDQFVWYLNNIYFQILGLGAKL